MSLLTRAGWGVLLAGGVSVTAGWLFGEEQARYLLAIAPDRLGAALELARDRGVLARRVGTTGGAALTLDGGNAISLDELAGVHDAWLPAYMAARRDGA